MATTIEYAVMAGRAYLTTRDKMNWFPVPDGWLDYAHVPNNPDYPQFTGADGFEAVSFQNIANPNDIVISFAGTYDKPANPLTNPDMQADIGLALGTGSAQLLQAADYYLQVKAAYTINGVPPNITLTGHSLGGGLAALIGVFFGVEAHTFDQAPFAQTALFKAQSLLDDLLAEKNGSGAPLYTADQLQGLSNFIQQQQANGGIPNSNLVANIDVQGEFLSGVPWNIPDRIGTTTLDITNSSTGVSGTTLHAQALLTAFLQSTQAAASGSTPQQTLSEVTKKLTDLLKLIFDESLFAHRTDTGIENFLERLVKHQAGVRDSATGATTLAADAMVTRFTTDLWKIAQDGGLTLTDKNLSDALTAFAMQTYYEDTAIAKDKTKQLYTDVTGGIQFDMKDVSTTFVTAATNNEVFELDKALGFKEYFRKYLENYWDANTSTYSPDKALILSLLPYMRDWYVQAGASALIVADDKNRNAFMLGGSGTDALIGGTGADLLVGNGGADTLMGKEGNDYLLGGEGADTYIYTTGDGLDTIQDADGGTIYMDDVALTGGAQYGDNKVHRSADGKHLYVQADAKTLIIDGNIIINNYSANFGLAMTGIVADVNPVTTHDIFGDPLKHTDTVAPGVRETNWLVINVKGNYQDDGNGGQTLVSEDVDYYLIDTNGNTIEGGGPERADSLGDTAANDHIRTGGKDDIISATRGGDDLIESGAGRDRVTGGSGNDVIIGGADSDILSGGAGADRIYADTQIDVAAAITQGNAQQGAGQAGDWLNGGAGDDMLVGSNANDLLAGGAGSDLLIGGAGNDVLLGDNDTLPVNFPAQTWHYDLTLNDIILENRQYNIPSSPDDSGNDVIYAGSGNDVAFGGYGNDVIFGEGGDDILQGNSGNDVLLGGTGEDTLYGDSPESYSSSAKPGDDYLDGGEGDDTLYGNEGDDILIGGKDFDTLYGGTGKDTYIFNSGDGVDHIIDTVNNDKSNTNILRFGTGISEKGITLRFGSLLLDLGNGDAIHIDNFDQTDVFNSSSIGSFEFADGTILSLDELLARGFDIDGTAGDDTLIGTNTTDRINGYGGNDTLICGAVNDDNYDLERRTA